jgi:RHS repeat-associated protein
MTIENLKRTASLLVFFVAIVAVYGVQAQDYVYDTGSPMYAVKIPIEKGYIDVSNGNLHLELPLSTTPQRGKLQLNEKLEYDSRIWKIVPSSGYKWQPTNVPNGMAGWRLTTGMESTGSIWYYTQNEEIVCGEGEKHIPYNVYSDFEWTDSQGTPHTFSGSTTQVPADDCYGRPILDSVPSFTATAYDGSGYTISVENFTDATIYDNSGNRVYPTPMDTNGNSFSRDANGNLVDTVGRTPVVKTVSGNTIYYDVLTIGGTRARYTVITTPISVKTAFGQSAVGEFTGTLTAVQRIILPDGTSYSFSYDAGTASGHYGEMTAMTLPTGATVNFSYINFQDSYQNKNQWLQNYSGSTSISFYPRVLTQCSSGGTGCQEQIIVSRGGNDSVYTLTLNKGAWNTQTDVYQGATTQSNVNRLFSTVTNFDYSPYHVTTSDQTTTLPDTGQTAKRVYSYNGSGQPTAIKEWDYYTGTTPATPTRETDYEYFYTINGANLLTKSKLLDYTGTPVAQTVYNYDGNGNVTSIVEGLSSSGGPLTTTKTYDAHGSALSSQDPLGHTTTYQYDSTDTCVIQTTRPTTSNGVAHISKAECDGSTGLTTSSTDENGQKTTYTYDPNTLRPSAVSYPDGGNTTYSYPSANQTIQTVAQTSTSSTVTTTNLDSYGRQTSVVISDSAGDVTTATTYDSSGNVQCVSNPHRAVASSTDGTTCFTYDALARVLSQIQPDLNLVVNTYSGNTVKTTDESGNKKKYVYDAFQNLTAVWEPDKRTCRNWETDYQYNALNKLVRIDQKGGSTDSGQWRTRLFQYNSLGQLTKETTPEASDTNYTYDGAGNVKTVQNGNGTVTYTYDELNRVTQNAYSDNSAPSTYTYDLTTWGAQYPAGRMVVSSRGSGAAEYYSYDQMGRIVRQSNPRASNTSVNAYIVNAAYDLAGNLTSLSYPDGRVISQGFDNVNRLISVTYGQWGSQPIGTPYVASLAYAPTGALTSATFGNGIQLSAAYNSRQGIASLQYQQNNNTVWSKQYGWAANAKNLVTMTDNLATANSKSYSYDTSNRLLSVTTFNSANSAPASSGTATITFSGGDQNDTFNMCPNSYQEPYYCPGTSPNYGDVTVTINGSAYSANYQLGTTADQIASSIANAMNSGSLITAVVSNGSIIVRARATGASSNYSLSTSCTTYNSQYYNDCAWSASGPGSLSGGNDGSYPGATLEEAYSYDPWGNLTQSGIWNFQQSFGTNNQINGYGYDAAGNLTNDGITYSYTPDGLLASSNGATYTYDAESHRVRKDASSGATEYIYFGSQLMAERNASTGAWTDFINGPGGPIAEVAGTQTATPIYRVTDHLGSLAQTRDSSVNPLDSITFLPYGQTESGSTTDSLRFTGLEFDSENSSYHAWFRQHSPAQGRWLTPDPYDGSYDLSDPQSLNRYAYVNGNPLYMTDPSGQGPEMAGLCASNPFVCIGVGVLQVFQLFHLFGGHHPVFHGSLTPRPSVGGGIEDFPNGESLGIPRGMSLPNPSLASIFLPDSAGCEFGPCAPVGNGMAQAAVLPYIAPCLSNPACASVMVVATVATVGYYGYKYYMGRVQSNEWTDKAKQFAPQDPCGWLADQIERPENRDSATQRKIVRAQKFLKCRNIGKRTQ